MKSSKPSSFRSRRLKPEELLKVYQTLHGAFGHQHWWPGETPFEVIVGAILTQNTAWTNVEKAIANLKKTGSLDPRKMNQMSEKKLAELIRPSGYFNIKARRLKSFLHFFFSGYGGSISRLAQEDGEALREKLLKVKGIGPETADSILLYALNKSYFVIDAYTKRIFSRHRLWNGIDYENGRRIFTEALRSRIPDESKLAVIFNDFHAQIVALGKNFCKSKDPQCKSCPLEVFL